MYIRRTRFDDFDDWIDSIDWRKAKSRAGRIFFRVINAYIRFVEKIGKIVGNGAMYLLLLMMGILLYSIVTNAIHRPSYGLWKCRSLQWPPTTYLAAPAA